MPEVHEMRADQSQKIVLLFPKSCEGLLKQGTLKWE